MKALQLVATAIIHIGRRSDLAILTIDGIEPRQVADAIVANTTFAVRQKTLH